MHALFAAYILNLHYFLIYSCPVWPYVQFLIDPRHLLPGVLLRSMLPGLKSPVPYYTQSLE